jgi:hypothetical protein
MLGKVWGAGYASVLFVLVFLIMVGVIGGGRWSDNSWFDIALFCGFLIVGVAELIKAVEPLEFYLLKPFCLNPKLTRNLSIVGYVCLCLGFMIDFLSRHFH